MSGVVGRPMTIDQASEHLRNGRVICDRLTRTAIQVVVASLDVFSGGFGAQEQQLRDVCQALAPLCPCDPNPETSDGPVQECPLHGDPEFVAEVMRRLVTDYIRTANQVLTEQQQATP